MNTRKWKKCNYFLDLFFIIDHNSVNSLMFVKVQCIRLYSVFFCFLMIWFVSNTHMPSWVYLMQLEYS